MSTMRRIGQRNLLPSVVVVVLISLLLEGGNCCLGGER